MLAFAGVVLGLAVAVAGIAMVSIPAAAMVGGLVVTGVSALFVDVKPKKEPRP